MKITDLKRILFMTLIIFLGSFAIFTFVFQKSAKGTTPATLNLMTFNWKGESQRNATNEDWLRLANYVKNNQIDVIAIPECTGLTPAKMIGIFSNNSFGYRMYTHNPAKARGDQCIFSKYPIENYVDYGGRVDDTDYQNALQSFSVNYPGVGPIWFLAIHPWAVGVAINAAADWYIAKSRQYANEGKTVFLMGDFNESPLSSHIRTILTTHNTVCPYGQPTCETTVTGSYCTDSIHCSTDHIFYPKNKPWQLTSGYVEKTSGVLPSSDHYAVVGKFIYQQGPIPTPCSPPAPQNLSPSGNTLSGQHAFTWNSVPGATRYALRIDDRANSWTGSCTNVNPRDICLDNLTTNSYNYTVQAGHTYHWWVHALNSCGWSSQTSANITGVAPTPTPTLTPTPTSTPRPTATPTPTPIPGDFNQDGRVDIFDLRYVLSNFTDVFDYSLVVANFGQSQ